MRGEGTWSARLNHTEVRGWQRVEFASHGTRSGPKGVLLCFLLVRAWTCLRPGPRAWFVVKGFGLAQRKPAWGFMLPKLSLPVGKFLPLLSNTLGCTRSNSWGAVDEELSVVSMRDPGPRLWCAGEPRMVTVNERASKRLGPIRSPVGAPRLNPLRPARPGGTPQQVSQSNPPVKGSFASILSQSWSP